MKIGFSKDIHRLVENRSLVLGGVQIPFDKGCLAHSDGDVVYHCLAESILGALALGDLGTHFPNTDEKFKNMDSSIIISYVHDLMQKNHYQIGNIDIQIIIEKPKLADYILKMRNNIANLLHCDISCVSIKAGTNEGIDEIGKGLAVEAYAIVLLNNAIEN